MALDESEFEKLATQVIEQIAETVDDVLGDQIDVDVHGGILTMTLPGKAQYIINKHGPNREIWLSSPVSGAAHFALTGEKWISTRNPDLALHELVTKELSERFDTPFSL